MKVLGLVAEYNPFHNGHKYHIEKSKENSNCDYTLALMSGNFVQRGEPAIIDKWSRAKMAIDNGIDLVLELPTLYSSSSAEFFSYGAIKLLDSLNIIDSICFGSESNDIDSFIKIANILVKEPEEFKINLKERLKEGVDFPTARSYALSKTLPYNDKIFHIMNSPNNILAIEYIKWLIKLNSSIKPKTIQRINSSYNQKKLSGRISSATSIRKHLITEGFTDSVKNTMPYSNFEIISTYLREYGNYNSIFNFNDILLYKLRTVNKNYLKNILDVKEGLHNRILDISNYHDNIIDIISGIKTKRYTHTRIQRILMHILLDIHFERHEILNFKPYARILASNQKGFEILKEIKKKSDVPIINKVANHRYNNDPCFQLDIRSSNIYFLGVKNNTNIKNNFDYYISPYIKTK